MSRVSARYQRRINACPALARVRPDLIDWLERNGASLFLSVLTIAGMEAGILKLPRDGKTARADELSALIQAILTDFDDRVLPVDTETARHVARLGEQSHRQPIGLANLIIAATAVRHGLILPTRNMDELGRLGIAARDPFVQLPANP